MSSVEPDKHTTPGQVTRALWFRNRAGSKTRSISRSSARLVGELPHPQHPGAAVLKAKVSVSWSSDLLDFSCAEPMCTCWKDSWCVRLMAHS
ncbi:hypothetical protein P7K49_032607 [Saguinus oedipus]|uniref:Uncharacterized protein n=1 Tax=Saguinus oedipus TaxID=9490 RepID=A0ABQ9TYR3_SAGOE|nr:hypothetical protein P7K49_032607 [Saguinus oedipus]